jgi:hypothetical protein
VDREYGTLEYGAGYIGQLERESSAKGKDAESTDSVNERLRIAEGASGGDGENTTASAVRIRLVSLNPTKDSESTSAVGEQFRAGSAVSREEETGTSGTAVRTRTGRGAVAKDGEEAALPFLTEEIQEQLREITEGLPDWMPKRESANADLLAPVAHEIKGVEKDTDHVYNVSTLQLAPTEEDVEKHAEMVGIDRTTNNREVLRAKTLVGFSKNTSQGTAPQVLRAASTLLDVAISDIEYREPGTGGGLVELRIPESVIEESGIPRENFVKLVTEFCAAGFGVQILWESTFSYKTVEEYQNGEGNPSKGYNTLDTDGNIVDSGGNYTSLDTYE